MWLLTSFRFQGCVRAVLNPERGKERRWSAFALEAV